MMLLLYTTASIQKLLYDVSLCLTFLWLRMGQSSCKKRIRRMLMAINNTTFGVEHDENLRRRDHDEKLQQCNHHVRDTSHEVHIYEIDDATW